MSSSSRSRCVVTRRTIIVAVLLAGGCAQASPRSVPSPEDAGDAGDVAPARATTSETTDGGAMLAAESKTRSSRRQDATRDAARQDGSSTPRKAEANAADDADAGTSGQAPSSHGDDTAQQAGDRDSAAAEILTQRYNNSRTGANLNETVLTRDNASALSLLGSWHVDAEIYAQVLVAAAVQLDDGERHAVAIVATMNDTLYAFDADAAPADAFLWQQGLHGELGTPAFCARNISGPNGILSTPVIDKQRGHAYVVARDCDPQFPPEMPRCQHRLFRIALATGKVLESTAIQGEVRIRDDKDGKDSERKVVFDPSAHWNRPGLLLQDDTLIVAFGSGPAGNQHEEDFVYHGWAFRYRVTDLARPPEVYCTTPRGRGGSVWQSGAAPAADDQGVYLTGANGIQADGHTHPPSEWPKTPVGQEDSLVRLPHTAWSAPQADVPQYWDDRDYIAAGNIFQHMESGDNGFGSSGPMLIPDSHLLLVGTKAGLVYLLDRGTLQTVQQPLSPFTDLDLQPGHTLYLHSWWGVPMITQTFVFWRPDAARTDADNAPHDGYAYAWASHDRLRQFRFDYAHSSLALTKTADVTDVAHGGNLVLSAAGGAADSGVLWATTRRGDGSGGPEGTLWAFDPLTLEVLLQVDTPAWSKFNPPTVVRGRVFVPSTAPDQGVTQQVLVYGLPH